MHDDTISLVAQVQRGLRRNANDFAIKTAISALGHIAAAPEEDKNVDKWLYQLIGRAVEMKVGCLNALALADTLEARLKRRVDAASFEVAALRAGASVNAARLKLEDVVAAPRTECGVALALRGARGAIAISGLFRAIPMDQRKICSISPQSYAESLRATLSRAASKLEGKSPELADLAWRCRRAAVEALMMATPNDVSSAASEAIRGLAIHTRIAPVANIIRTQWFASLTERLEPRQGTPAVVFEWFLRHARALEAVCDNDAAATVRFTGRLHLCQDWPLFSGILYCGDLQSKDPSMALSEATKCFRTALDNRAQARYETIVWRRAWTSLSHVSASFEISNNLMSHDDSPAEAALLVLADIVGRCQEYHYLDMRDANTHRAEAYWRAATLAADRGVIDAAAERCNIAEVFSSPLRVALGLIKTGLAALRQAKRSDELCSATALLERATGFPHSWSVAWIALAGCLACLELPFEAAVAAAEATCHSWDANSIHDSIAHYFNATVHINKRAPTLLLVALQRANARFAAEVLSEQLLACQARGSNLELIVASEELAVWNFLRSKPAFSHASILLVRRGAFRAGLMLAWHATGAACHDHTAIAWCVLALATTILDSRNDAFQILALSAITRTEEDALDAKSLVSALVAMKDMFSANKNFIGESSTCDAFGMFAPPLWPAVVASSAAAIARDGFVLLAQSARTDLDEQITVAKTRDCTMLNETRHFKLLMYGTLGGGNSKSALTLAFDEARASLRRRAIADIGLQILDGCMHRGDTVGASNTSLALEDMLRLPRNRKRGVLLIDSVHSQMIKTNSLWLYLAHLWLVCGYKPRSIKYSQRAVSSKHDRAIARWAAATFELSTYIWARDWRRATTVLGELDCYVETNFPSRIRSLKQVIIKGDLLRRQGNFQDAGLCYMAAEKILLAVQSCFTELTAGCFVAVKATRRGFPALFSRQYYQIMGRIAHLVDLQGSQLCAEAIYRTALRSQPSYVLDSACLRYRLGRIFLKRAFMTNAASADALDQLWYAFLTAWRAHHWRLATKSARALIVAALHFVPGAISSPTIALLAHASLGQARLTLAARDNPTSSLSTEVARFDNIIDSMLNISSAQGVGWHETIGFTFDDDDDDNAIFSLDRLLSPLPNTYSVVATLIAPTGHLVMARVQRSQAPITLCAPLPKGWHDFASTSDSAVSLCCNALRASAQGLRMDIHSVDDNRNRFSSMTSTRRLKPNEIDKTTARTAWWSQRHSIDSALEAGLDCFDQTWLGAIRALLATEPVSRSICRAPTTVTSDVEHTAILSMCMNAAPYLSRTEASALLCASPRGVIDPKSNNAFLPQSLSNQTAKTVHSWLTAIALLSVLDLKAALCDLGLSAAGLKKQLANRLSEALELASCVAEHDTQINNVPAGRQPLILALDDRLHCLPIEDLAVPRGAPVSRVPSLTFALSLATQMRLGEWEATHVPPTMRACCVVDPDANLPATRHRINAYLDFEHGSNSNLQLSYVDLDGDDKPTADIIDQVAKQMPGCAAYLFCGHGHGSVYLEGALENQFLSVMFLMGCSSGCLLCEGDFEPRGVAVELLARGIPSVVAMLWDVTDRDIDRITLQLLQSLAQDPTGLIPDLLSHAKNVAKLRKLNGAAPVCYGLPISLAGLEGARDLPAQHSSTAY